MVRERQTGTREQLAVTPLRPSDVLVGKIAPGDPSDTDVDVDLHDAVTVGAAVRSPRALQHRPDLLILDEPTSGADALGRSALWDTIRSAAERGAGVIVTTHHMDEAEE